jgi:hypothetical protein
MAIDFSTMTSDEWKTGFERYITGGGNLSAIIERDEIEEHYKMCLPESDFPDKNLETTPETYIITGMHDGAGERFELVVDRVNTTWEFNWLPIGQKN